MATRCQPLIPYWLWPGLFTSALLAGVALLAFGALWHQAPDTPWQTLWGDSYVWFATVLSLGGVPRATTIELAIYQALSFDYDRARAAGLALTQMVCCLGLVLLSQRLGSWFAVGNTQQLRWRNPQDSLAGRLGDTVIIVAALFWRRASFLCSTIPLGYRHHPIRA